MEDTLYFAAGIWPSEGIYICAMNPENGERVWTKDKVGTLKMNQPHPGAIARSGVSAQGYLAATRAQVFVPSGRSVPAVFARADGALTYFMIGQKINFKTGGSAVVALDDLFFNGNRLSIGEGRALPMRTTDG